MAEIENLVLEQLRAIRKEIAEMREENRESRTRIAHLEDQSAGLFGQYATVSSRLDRMYDMLQRINTRLELVE